MKPAAHTFFVATLVLLSASRADPAAQELRLLALGDSFTIGTGSSPKESFPARLAAALTARGRRVVLENLGVNGYTTQNLLDRELPRVKAFAPTLVTLAIGANDLVHGSDQESYRAQLRRIFDGLAKAGVKPGAIVVIPQPDWARSPVSGSFGDVDELEARLERFNAILAEETGRAGARFVDLYPLMKRQAAEKQVAGDGLHPSAKAYAAWAEALQGQLPH